MEFSLLVGNVSKEANFRKECELGVREGFESQKERKGTGSGSCNK